MKTVPVAPHRRRPPQRSLLPLTGTGRPFREMLADEWDRAERADLAGQVRQADRRVVEAPPGARDTAAAEARRLRLALLSETLGRRSPAQLALAIAAWAKTSEVSVAQLDELCRGEGAGHLQRRGIPL